MKLKESGDPLTAVEFAKMTKPENAHIHYGERTAHLKLYRKFVREFIDSGKLERATKTGGVWHIDKKLKHVWRRYCGDEAYAGMSETEKREVMGKALFDAKGTHHPLERVGEDFAARENAELSSDLNPGMAQRVAVGLGEALANKATMGVYSLVKIGIHLRDGQRRREVAERYATQYDRAVSGSDDLTAADLRGLDADSTLGVAASFLAMKLDRFNRRQATLLAGQSLSVAGNALSAIPGLGQGLSVAGTVVSSAVTAEQAIRNLMKRIEGNLGIARETMAVALWGLGNRSHPPTLKFLSEVGILDEPGYLRSGGFFDEHHMRLASNFISTELKSTGKS